MQGAEQKAIPTPLQIQENIGLMYQAYFCGMAAMVALSIGMMIRAATGPIPKL